MISFPRELRHGSGVMMILDPTRLLLATANSTKVDEIKPFLKKYSLVLEDELDRPSATLPNTDIVNHTDHRFWVRSRNGKPIKLSSLEEEVSGILDWIGPVYRLPGGEGRGGLLCPLPNVLLIKPAFPLDDNTKSQLDQSLREHGLKEIPERSRYLSGYLYYVISDIKKDGVVYDKQGSILETHKQIIRAARLENMPMIVPIAVMPNDTLFAQQWNMRQIQVGGPGITGWDISIGDNTLVVCVFDSGCDLTHPDIQFSTPGVHFDNQGNVLPDGSPDITAYRSGSITGFVFAHGTNCAGILAGRYNNALGVAGVAGNCQIMPVAFRNWTDAEVTAGINYAADNGARVISMSFGQYAPGEGLDPTGWDFSLIDPAINHAFNDRGCVLCAATGNENYSSNNRYPARHPLVIACGASDQIDNRKSPASPDGEYWWGSNYGVDTYDGQTTGVSVVAPGVLIPTTDPQGELPRNQANGAAGDYFLMFNGTSSATPHVAGLAALLLSLYPTLTNVQVRDIIERTAEKVGVVPYAETPGRPNGTWNQEMGYGRINVFRALDFADMMIKDWPGDTGIEPSNPPGGNFWDFSDIVIRAIDDNVFVPGDPGQSRNVERGQTNYIYIRVTNNGPREARNVVVNARIRPFVGLQFVYPDDWTRIDAEHVSPTPVAVTFATIPSGGSAIAKFTISSSQVEDLWGWGASGLSWDPCLLAEVRADNDYAFATASLTGDYLSLKRNNLAQRNLSVVDVWAGASATFPFLAGSRYNAERFMEILVDRGQLPADMQLLVLLDDNTKAFPLVDLTPPVNIPAERGDNGIVFLDRAKIEAKLGSYRGVLTLEKGSRFDLLPFTKIKEVSVKGGEIIIRNNLRFAEIRDKVTSIRISKQPNQLYPLALQTSIPVNAQKGTQYMIRIAQRNEMEDIVGGASIVYVVK